VMNYEEGLIDVVKMMKLFQFEWKESLMRRQSKLEESLTRFEFKVEEHITQARQDLSLLSDKFLKSIETTVKEKKNILKEATIKEMVNKERQVQSSRLRPNQ
ncbi:hypothetical protein Tco_0419813, partial [Tanacetum coccineum]